MRLLILTLFLSATSAMAHDTSYVCKAVCSFDRGNGNERVQLTSQNFDEQTAFEAILGECENLNGVLLPTDNGNGANAICRVVWH